MSSDTYWLGAIITGIIFFIGLWVYAMTTWGLLLGLLIGWIPAVIGAALAALLWPVIVLIVIGLFLLIRNT